MKKIIITAVLAQLLLGCASSTQYLAQQGDTEAQFTLGTDLVEQGKYPQAVDWLTQSAQGGHVEAMFQLGEMYQYGQGIDKSPEQAFQWYLKAAEAGHATAQSQVGKAYRYGVDGADSEFELARYWLAQSLRPENARLTEALLQLGAMYMQGEGGASNYTQAVDLFLAALRFPERAEGYVLSRAEKHYAQEMINDIYTYNEPYTGQMSLYASKVDESQPKPTYKVVFESKEKPIIVTGIELNDGRCQGEGLRAALWIPYEYGSNVRFSSGTCDNVYKINIETLNYGTITFQ